MNRTAACLAGIALLALSVADCGPVPVRADTTDHTFVVASGTLDGRFLAGSLFHIGEFWMRVAEGTDFHRWLENGLGRRVVIRLTADPSSAGDDKSMRILSGALIHETAPKSTPVTTGASGRLPEGDSAFVHVFFVTDDIAGSTTLSPVTFETADVATVSKFAAFEGAHINIVIQLR
jgi:hypothetical protein